MKNFFLYSKTKNIGFSTWSYDDINETLQLWGNPNVTKYITSNGKMTEEEIYLRLEKEIETQKKYDIQYWPIYLTDKKENIGCCGLRPYGYESSKLEIGIHLKENCWGKGYAKEACLTVIEYAFETLKIESLFAGHNPKNKASSKLIRDLGFTYTHDEFYAPTGLNHPSYIMTSNDYYNK